MARRRRFFNLSKKEHVLPTKDQLIRIADIYFKVAIIVSFFLMPVALLLGTREPALFICVLALALAIPTLALSITTQYVHGHMAKSTLLLGGIGTVSCFIAITAAFWHFSWIAGTTFLLAALIGDVLIACFD